jgi:hypothetical protein
MNTKPEEIDEVEKVYQEFWAELLSLNGVLSMALVKKELFDYYNFLDETAKVYDHVTGGRISKPNTLAVAVNGEADARVDELIAEALDDEAQSIYELCLEIEKLPASEQQTKISVMASDIYKRFKAAEQV